MEMPFLVTLPFTAPKAAATKLGGADDSVNDDDNALALEDAAASRQVHTFRHMHLQGLLGPAPGCAWSSASRWSQC